MAALEQPITDESIPGGDAVFARFKEHNNKNRVATGLTFLQSLRQVHPDFYVTFVAAVSCDLLAYAEAGNATAELDTEGEGFYAQRTFLAASRRSEEARGTLGDHVAFGKYAYHWNGQSFLIYLVEWPTPRGGTVRNFYVLAPRTGGEASSGRSSAADELILAASEWSTEVHEEIYVFDSGMWTKNQGLWKSVQKATWDEVILDSAMKKTLIDDIEGFFDRRDVYKQFSVPWKRGIIFHGVPGNGKTISIKALMRTLSARSRPVPSLYVKSFDACQGLQYSVRTIFAHARNMAPCLLIFEDIDSLVTEKVRSYFLNEVDGLESNEGIMMIGSTNHLEKLDPAISKRPSRFDRKYHFKLPAETERAAYCEYWRGQLAKNPSIDFPPSLSPVIAKITDGFSFAYLKELFVTALLVIVGGSYQDNGQETLANGKDTGSEINNNETAVVNGSDGDKRDANGISDGVKSNLLMRIVSDHVQTLKSEMDNTAQNHEKVPGGGDPMDFRHMMTMAARSVAY